VLPLVWNETSTHLQTFDIILGADLVYDEMVFDDLRNMLRMLSNDQTIIFISGRIRYDRDRRFYADLKNDFDVHEIEYDQRTDVRLFKMTRLQY
jgi:predicted nicotinamide N-methyase